MKKWICLFCLVLISPTLAKFNEGLIKMNLTTSQGNGSIELKISPKGMRYQLQMTDLPLKLDFLIMNDNANFIYQIDNASKTYVEMDLKGLANDNSEKKNKYKIKKLGTEKILGYKTHHLLIETDKEKSEIWIAKDIDLYNTIKKVMKAMKGNVNQGEMFDALEKKGYVGFPLKTVQNVGGENTVVETVKLEKKKFPNSLFTLPKDYTKSTTGAMIMQQFADPEKMEAIKKAMQKNMTPEQMKMMEQMMQQMKEGQQTK